MSSVPQHHPAVTRERIEKALSPDYLVQASTNLLNIRYVEHQPLSRIHSLSFGKDKVHYRPTFAELLQQQRIPYTSTPSSPWEPITIGHSFTPTWSTHWLCIHGTVPEKWIKNSSPAPPPQQMNSTAATTTPTATPAPSSVYRPYLLLDPSCEAMIYTENGVPLTGITGGEGKHAYRGSRRTELLLTPDLYDPITGEFCFYVEVACNGLFGANGALTGNEDLQGRFTLEIAEMALLDTVANDFFWDFIVLKDLANHGPKTAVITERAVLVANAILNTVDRRDRSTFHRARKLAAEIFRIDPYPAQSLLSNRYDPSENRVYAIGNCHIDSAWLWRYAETRRKIARSWASQTRYMDYGSVYGRYHQPNIYKNIIFTASQSWQYAVLVQDYPHLAKKVQQYIADGQFIPVGNSWVEPDANMPSGEALIRQLLYGTQFITKYFGKAIIQGSKQRSFGSSSSSVSSLPSRIPHGNGTYWLPDTFGYCPQLPQIIRGAGLRYFLTQKLSWNLVNKPVHNTFWWSALDGSTVLTHFPPADTYCAHGDVPDIVKSTENNKDSSRSSVTLMLYGHGDGGGGPTIPMFEQMHRLGAKSLTAVATDTTGSVNETYIRPLPALPHVYYGTPLEFFDSLVKDLGRAQHAYDAVTIKGELFLELHNGTLTSQAKMKSGNRYCEQLLHSLEFLATFVCLLSRNARTNGTPLPSYAYPTRALRRLWKRVLLNQFHDVLPGSSVADVHKDAEIIHNNVLVNLEKLIYAAQSSFLSVLPFRSDDNGSTMGYAYVNCTPYKRVHTLAVPRSFITTGTGNSVSQIIDDHYALVQFTVPPYGTTVTPYPPYNPNKEGMKDRILSYSSVPFPNDPECSIQDNAIPSPSSLATANINYAYISTKDVPFRTDKERSLEVYECVYGPYDPSVNASHVSSDGNALCRNYIVVDTNCVRVIFSKITGHIVSLIDQRTPTPREIIANPSANDGFEIASPALQSRNAQEPTVQGGNRFLLYDDVPFFWDAWDTFAYSLEKVQVATGTLTNDNDDTNPPALSSSPARSSSSVWKVAVTVLEAGPLRCRIRCVYPSLGYNKETWLSQDILLHRNSALIQFNTVIEWHEQHKMLKVEFPLQLTGTSVAVYDTQFGCIERPTHTNTSRDAMQFEVCGHKWGDLSQPDYGVALLNNSKYGYSCRNNRLRLSLLRSPKAPDNQCDMGRHYFSYALLPHIDHVKNNAIDVLAEAWHLNNPVLSIPQNVPTVKMNEELSLFAVTSMDGRKSSSMVLDTVKCSESSVVMNDMNGTMVDDDYDRLDTTSNETLNLPTDEEDTVPLSEKPSVIIRCYEPYGNLNDSILVSLLPIESMTYVNLLEEEFGQEGLPLAAEEKEEQQEPSTTFAYVPGLGSNRTMDKDVAECFLRHPLPSPPRTVMMDPYQVHVTLQPFQIATFRITF